MAHETRRHAVTVGLFVLLALALAGAGVFAIGRNQWLWKRTFTIRAEFRDIGGVAAGTRARVQGIDAGLVEGILQPAQPGGPVTLVIRLDEQLHSLVRRDAVARIGTEGMVGGKVIEIQPGSSDSPVVGGNATIRSERPIELAEVMAHVDRVLFDLGRVARSARAGIDDIDEIARTIRDGRGTVGKLVMSDEAYQSATDLGARAGRTVDALKENLDALKKALVYVGYTDQQRLLYRTGERAQRRVYKETDLFEVGRSTLTEAGKAKLNEAAQWIHKFDKDARSDVVIAAFIEDAKDLDQAKVLAEDQAHAVQTYLTEKQSIHKLGLISRRKVEAAGYAGAQPSGADSTANEPPRRLEVVVFTPG